jgi:hypothetical protein
MSTASVALIALIGWLSGLQTLRVGRDRNPRPPRAVLVTTAALGVGAALLVGQQLTGPGAGPRADPTAVVLVALLGWIVGLQTLGAGRDRSPRPSPVVLVTTVVLSGGAVLLVVPHLYRMVT